MAVVGGAHQDAERDDGDRRDTNRSAGAARTEQVECRVLEGLRPGVDRSEFFTEPGLVPEDRAVRHRGQKGDQQHLGDEESDHTHGERDPGRGDGVQFQQFCAEHQRTPESSEEARSEDATVLNDGPANAAPLVPAVRFR